MDEFDNLENNVGRAIELIQSLFQKNEELHKENGILIKKITEQKDLVQHLQEENQKLKSNPDNINYDKEKENKIRIKINHIIDKLESFEKLSNNQ
ncbi:hypothetical protein H8E88_19870 [candidate division KSB1 bacterium]|nr:hypothetical protein [candidate division KSB1 bacterium]MBL7094280.1 hypothetical protein [candidate division KSB1 bacterium]